MNDGYTLLASAIIEQANEDYRLALISGNGGAVRSIERFYLSNYGQTLCRGYGKFIINRIRKECGKELRKW